MVYSDGSPNYFRPNDTVNDTLNYQCLKCFAFSKIYFEYCMYLYHIIHHITFIF